MMTAVTGLYDPIPATVIKVTMADAARQESDVAYFQPDRVLVEFSGLVNVDLGGTHSALNVSNWRLMSDGVDVSNLIAGVQVLERINNQTNVAVHFSERLGPGNYRIIALDLIHNQHGLALNGDSDTNDELPGGNADVTFMVADATSDEEISKLARSPARSLPVVAADAAGNYVVAWAGSSPDEVDSPYSESKARIYAQRYNSAGQKVGGLILVAGTLSTSGYEEYSDLGIAMSSDGAFVVNWTTQPNGNYITLGQSRVNFARRFNASGVALSNAFQIGAENSHVSSMAFADSGELIVGYMEYPVWSLSPPPWQYVLPLSDGIEVVPAHAIFDPGDIIQAVKTTPELFIQRYDASGNAVSEAIDLGVGFDLRLDINDLGVITAVWNEQPYGEHRLVVQQFNPRGNSPGEKVYLDSLSGRGTAPAIAIDSAGTVTIAWDQESDGIHQIYLQQFNSNLLAQGQPVLVSESTSEFVARISIAMHPGGSFFVVWDASGAINHLRPNYYGLVVEFPKVDAEPGSVRARSFDATGTARSNEFAFGSIEANAGDLSSVAPEPGKLVTAWLDGGYYRPVAGDSFYHHRVREINIRDFMVPIGLIVDLNGDPPGINIKRNFVPGGSPALLGDPDALQIHTKSETIASATITIEGYQVGDVLLTYSTNPKIHWGFNAGVLTLTGVDTVANYQSLLNDIWFSSTADRPAGSKVDIRVVVNDGEEESLPAYSYISIHVPGRSSIAGRQLFYNDSSFDSSDPTVTPADDAAIAPDKTPLLPGQTATKDNYSGYSRGINGIMVDIAGEHGEITLDDFIFRVGNTDDPSSWAVAPTPRAIVVRPGAGIGGSDRVEIIWDDNVIANTWLQVIVLDNGDTGLAEPDIFYFGNRVGDTGNEASRARPQTFEALQIINRILDQSPNASEALIDDPLDFDRNGRIDSRDLLIIFNAILDQKGSLNMIEAPGGLDGMQGAIIIGAIIEFNLVDVSLPYAIELNPAEPLAAVFADWGDAEESQFTPSLVNASLLMEDPESR